MNAEKLGRCLQKRITVGRSNPTLTGNMRLNSPSIITMGNFLSILSSGRHILELSYLDCSSMKLREYYASFKLICEGFTLDSTEFSQIFGPSVNAFSVWDVERRRRIDALEMFSGLILFSNARFDDKVQFLFEVFDLNE